MKQPYFTRGSGFSTLASLMNHSCFHNAKTCFTEDLKTVVYALQPIKKNSQVFNIYNKRALNIHKYFDQLIIIFLDFHQLFSFFLLFSTA